eukprot:TRINITY_DN98286_c0_g1_i3.p1 TRINITY_DN98286_c0_g1~~TRINITY_DN98286_c0_g1_i3.p1  ORF type:complete len:119 (-),score=43.49 TRINITY_DN98286_c0_g1_i3:94-450(-)
MTRRCGDDRCGDDDGDDGDGDDDVDNDDDDDDDGDDDDDDDCRVVQILIERNRKLASIVGGADNWAPLHLAAMNGMTAIAGVLVKKVCGVVWCGVWCVCTGVCVYKCVSVSLTNNGQS